MRRRRGFGAGRASRPAGYRCGALAKRISEWDEYTGRFEAVQRVEVQPRVNGYIAQIHFVNGSIVAKVDVLFAQQAEENGMTRFEAAVAAARTGCARS